MLKDPKFGYHWIWLLPAYWVYTLYLKFTDKPYKPKHTVELDRLRKLAGITNDNKD